MNLDIPKEAYREIKKVIESDSSPVGIDAAHTHILIIQKLISIEKRLDNLEKQIRKSDD